MNIGRRKLFTTAAGLAAAVAAGPALEAAGRAHSMGQPISAPTSIPKPPKLTPEEIVARDQQWAKDNMVSFLDSDNPYQYTLGVSQKDRPVLEALVAGRGLVLEHMQDIYWKAGGKVFLLYNV